MASKWEDYSTDYSSAELLPVSSDYYDSKQSRKKGQGHILSINPVPHVVEYNADEPQPSDVSFKLTLGEGLMGKCPLPS